MILIIQVILTISFSLFSIPDNYKRPNKVYLHLEKFNERYNLLHVGISFDNNIRKIRYDYRAFKNDQNYLTDDMSGALDIFPTMYIPQDIDEYANIEKRKIYWGTTNKTIHEIILFEKSLRKRYILGIYDCRHYVNKFSIWALNKPSPIWNLHILWNSLENDINMKDDL